MLKNYYKTPETLECGIDEAGRGCLFGRVYVAAVVLNPEIPPHKYLNDSKKVTPKRRAEVRQWIEENAIAFSVSYSDASEIDKSNITSCVMDSMHRCVHNLGLTPDLLLVDGNYFTPIYTDDMDVMPYVTIIGGDGQYSSIAAASILAKEYHDEYIRDLCILYPNLEEKYGLTSHKGYGSKKHCDAIVKYGPSEYHRKSFLRKILAIANTQPV
jgi:ribonuclease HII